MHRLPPLLVLLLGTLVGSSGALAAEHDASGSRAPLRVLELFTSHGCSSCPPADELLGRLIDERADLIALEYHVDYWNRLVHGADGNWVDPFSDADWTLRQRAYDMAALDGRRGVYTPQAIVNGAYAAVGSDAGRIAWALDGTQLPMVAVRIEPAGERYAVTVDADMADGAEIVLLRYRLRADTRVTGGENRHRTLVNHHVVLTRESLGRVDTEQPLRFSIAAPGEGRGCAVLVQDRMMRPILGAARCPQVSGEK